MLANKQFGRCGEQMACDYLKNMGYQIIAQNYQVRLGEIDIIAIDKNTYVFVEVKSRKTKKYGRAAEAVNNHKKDKIIKTALCYLKFIQKNDVPCRFDVIEVYINNGSDAEINHIKSAFIE